MILSNRLQIVTLVLSMSAVAACGDDGGDVGGAGAGGSGSGAGGVGGSGGGEGGASSSLFPQVETQVLGGCGAGFGPMTCHGREPFAAGLDLTPGHAYGALVNVSSTLPTGGLRVKPDDYAASFLYRKLTNDLATDGSEGGPMPQGEGIMWTPRPAGEIDLLKSWILDGAKP